MGRESGTTLGAGIAGRAAQIAADSTVYMRQKMADHNRKLAALMLEDFFDLVGGEVRQFVGPHLKQLIAAGDLDDNTRALLDFVASGGGQFASMVGTQITGMAISTGLGALLSNSLQPAAGRIIALAPSLPLGVDAAARAAATGLTHGLDAAYDAAQQGLDARKFEILTDLARINPDVSTILDLYNRGTVSHAYVVNVLSRSGLRPEDVDAVISARQLLLTPATLADMVVRGVIPQGQATQVANGSGLTDSDFSLLVANSGEPPAIQELLFAFRRGFIDQARLEHGIRQSRVKDEWIPDIIAARYVPMSTADAVEATLKGHLDQGAAAKIAQENGLMPEHFDILLQTAGSPPGVQDMLALWKRGIMTEAEVDQGIKESRLMNKYIPLVKAGAERLLPERTIVSLVGKGALTVEVGTQMLLKLGFAADVVAALMTEAHTTKTAKIRELTEAQTVELYRDGIVTRPDALSMLGTLGYDDQESLWILDLADMARDKRFSEAAIGRVHSAYIHRGIDVNQASALLDAMSVATDQRDRLLALWEIERSTVTRTLTVAEIGAALKRGLIDEQMANDRYLALGFSQDDATILVGLAIPAPKITTTSG
jgi:hypothetical protein